MTQSVSLTQRISNPNQKVLNKVHRLPCYNYVKWLEYHYAAVVDVINFMRGVGVKRDISTQDILINHPPDNLFMVVISDEPDCNGL